MAELTREDMQRVAKACSWFLLTYTNRAIDYECPTFNELSALSDLRSALAAPRREAVPPTAGTAA